MIVINKDTIIGDKNKILNNNKSIIKKTDNKLLFYKGTTLVSVAILIAYVIFTIF